jgi:hypothetical protein
MLGNCEDSLRLSPSHPSAQTTLAAGGGSYSVVPIFMLREVLRFTYYTVRVLFCSRFNMLYCSCEKNDANRDRIDVVTHLLVGLHRSSVLYHCSCCRLCLLPPVYSTSLGSLGARVVAPTPQRDVCAQSLSERERGEKPKTPKQQNLLTPLEASIGRDSASCLL